MGRASSTSTALFAAAVAGLCCTAQSPISDSTALRRSTILETMCTFRASEIQLCDARSASPVTYLQIDRILAADDSVLVDVRAQRPIQAGNSYERLERNSAWEVAKVTNGELLTITVDETDDGLRFAYESVQWTERDGLAESEERGNNGWCEEVEWLGSGEEWSCQDSGKTMPRVS